MIKAFSHRFIPPYSGLAQIVETERARAVSNDGVSWEIQFTHTNRGDRLARSYLRVAHVRQDKLADIARRASPDYVDTDERIVELAAFLVDASLPFPCADRYEYWLIDPVDQRPLVLVFCCNHAEQMVDFPERQEWTALTAAVMPIEPTEEETQRGEAPVNYRFERAVMRRAGPKPVARWFSRHPGDEADFPPCLVREDWPDAGDADLCRRYIDRQAPRLLMLQRLSQDDRARLEQATRPYAMEVDRFFPLYPAVVDEPLMNAIRVEAVLRRSQQTAAPRRRPSDAVELL